MAAWHLAKGLQEGAGVGTAQEAVNRQRYSDIPSCYVLEPVAVETLGAIGESSWKVLRDLARRVELQSGEKRAFAFLRQRLDVAVQRGNAACVLESAVEPN